MKKTIFILSLLFTIAAAAQKIQAPYPCLLPTTHDSLFQGTGVIPVPVLEEDCRLNWRLRKKCKLIVTGEKDSVIHFSYWDSTKHDSLQTCYRDSVIVAPAAATAFGAKIQEGNSEQQIEVLKMLGVKIARPTSIALSTYAGKAGRLTDFKDSAIFNIVNVNWQNSTTTIPFCTDLVKYRSYFAKFLNDFGYACGIIVIENEPTNQRYYSGTMQQNLALLRIAVEEVRKYNATTGSNIKITDGCVHVETVLPLVKPTAGRIPKGTPLADELLRAYRTIDLDFVNIHHRVIENTIVPGNIKLVADYIRSQTGHPIMSNEWHTEGCNGATVAHLVEEWKLADAVYSVIWGGGDQSEADAINAIDSKTSLMGLTSIGEDYRDAIKK